jgi:hypothetical protein
MPLFEETQKNNQQTNAGQQTESQNQTNQKPSGLLTTIGQLLPLAPFVFEQFTGQKVPQMTGTMAEIQLTLTNLQTSLVAIGQNQQQLMQRIVNLETSASQQLNNLTNQFNSLRLTHTREKRQIEYNNPNRLNEENQEETY